MERRGTTPGIPTTNNRSITNATSIDHISKFKAQKERRDSTKTFRGIKNYIKVPSYKPRIQDRGRNISKTFPKRLSILIIALSIDENKENNNRIRQADNLLGMQQLIRRANNR